MRFISKKQIVIDNTNATKIERNQFILLAKAEGYHIHGYFFNTSLQEALNRNRKRIGMARLPDIAIRTIHKRLEIPSLLEGFDQLWSVRVDGSGGFLVTTGID